MTNKRDQWAHDLVAKWPENSYPSDNLQQASKPNADCSGDPANCPDNEGYGCACSQPQREKP